MQRNFQEGFRLSHQQKHLWNILQEQDKDQYIARCAIVLDGPLQSDILHLALKDIVARYEILRTELPLVHGMKYPLQVIHEANSLIWYEVDQRNEDIQDVHSLYARCLDKAVLFPSTNSPSSVLTVYLVRLAEAKHILLLLSPALCADATTLRLLVSDMSRTYEHRLLSQEPLTTEVLQYADVAEWHHELLEGEDTDDGRKHWKERLFSASFTEQLPLEKVSRAHIPFRSQQVSFVLTPDLVNSIEALACELRVRSSSVLLAGWQMLLQRLLGEHEQIIGVAFDERKYAELEPIVGLFTQYIPLQSYYDESLSIADCIQRAERAMLDAEEWMEYFSWEIVAETQQHTPAHNLFAPFGFEVLNLASSCVSADLTMTMVDLFACIDRFNIKLSCLCDKNERTITLYYNEEKYVRVDMERLAERFNTILGSMVAHAQDLFKNVNIVGEEERRLLLDEENPFPLSLVNSCFHQLFEAQVERSPEALAVVFEDQKLTFQQLNERANQLAHSLYRNGVGPEVRVGLWIERSLDAIIGMLGILKAGGVYVPLEPTYPSERLLFLLEDAQIPVLVTLQHYHDEIQTLVPQSIKIICLDQESDAQSRQYTYNPAVAVWSKNNAYMIYTSGSSGKPKGVLVEHHALLNLLTALEQAVYKPFIHKMQKQAADVEKLHISVNAPLVFDASLQQIVMLLRGHCLYPIPQHVRTDGEALLAYLRQYRIQVFDCTPSQLKFLSAAGFFAPSINSLPKEEAFSYPQLLLIAGEAIEGNLWKTLLQVPSITCYNLYGPTECTVDATVGAIRAREDEEIPVPTIGCPLANNQVYLLDEQLQLVPIGVPAEVYIGGAGLARGYHGRPDLTAERFVPHPFSSQSGMRLYKTGDCAYMQSDRSLCFVGRMDNQVKLHGYRIELEEIEVVLRQHARVRDVAVQLCDDVHGEPGLVAYVTLRSHHLQSEEKLQTTVENDVLHIEGALRHWLQEHLPVYMLPTAFVVLEQMPLTISGKLDRKALPAPDLLNRSAPERPFVAPRTEEEKVLSSAWADALGCEQIGIDDNFFAMGGDSIRSIRAHVLSRKEGVIFTLQQLFKYQTIRELVQAQQNKKDAENMPVQVSEEVSTYSLISEIDRMSLPEDAEDAYPLAMLQAGMLFHSEYDTDTNMFQDTLSTHLRAPFNKDVLQQALRKLAQRHPILRTSFDLVTYSQPLQIVHRAAEIPLLIEDLSHLSDAEQKIYVETFRKREIANRFNWAQPPLLRVTIHLRSLETFQFTLTEHHAILDGWSVASLLTELFQQYLVLLGYTISFDETAPRALYRDFIAAEQAAIRSKQSQLFWQQKLRDASILTLPRWPSSLAVPRKYAPNVHSVTLDTQITEGLMRLAHLASVPLKSVVLAAHLYVLSVLSGSQDVLTGIVSNSRPEVADSERVIGLFLNTLPFRLNLPGGTWLDLVRHTFQEEIEMLPYRQYPQALLQNMHGREPLFEVAVNFAHFHVYKNLQNIQGIEPLDFEWSEQTNLALLVQFVIHPFTSTIAMDFHGYELSDEQIAAINGYYLKTLETMVSDPQALYLQHSLLSKSDLHTMLIEWNAPKQSYPEEGSVYELFARQVQRTPLAVAVQLGEEQLTYQQLYQRTEYVATLLAHDIVNTETIIGVLTDRSPDLLVALLAILRVGGVYLPLDPQMPVYRLAQIIAQSQPSVMLFSQKYRDKLAQIYVDVAQEEKHIHMHCLDDVWEYSERIEQGIDSLYPICVPDPQQVAYILFTSGSTGTPKGVMVTHGGLLNHLWAKIQEVSITSHDTIAQTASQAFVISLWQYLAALLVGGSVRIIPDTITHDPNALFGMLEQGKLSILEMVPTLLRLMLNEVHRNPLKALSWGKLRTLLVTGEALMPDLCQQWFSLAPSIPLINAYGPTECADDVTHYRIIKQPDEYIVHMSVGKPIANIQLYVLDQHLQPVPIGVPGELYIGGVCIGRGYLHQPILTAQAFVPNPWSLEPGRRLYKTGDLVCRQIDGSLQYLGRYDQQVKLRGYRIELKEIEAVLRCYPDIQEVVVLLREDMPENSYLTAYYVLSAQQKSVKQSDDVNVVHKELPESVTTLHLQQWLQTYLPEYMLPDVYIRLDAMPVTISGKLDKQALPVPDRKTRSIQVVSFVAPRTTAEKVVAEVWANVLGCESVGVYDDFFRTGGNSLLAMQMVLRLRHLLHIQLSIRSIFEMPTLEMVALHIEELLIADIERLSEEEVQAFL